MTLREIMTPDVQCVRPDDTLVEAAGLMRELDVGVVPVCENEQLSGVLTDRDIVVRAVADGRDPNDTCVREAMSPDVVFGYDDQSLEQAVQIMEQHQIRRLPVLNRNLRIVGIVSLGDIAVDASAGLSGEVLKEVSQPAAPTR